MPNIFNHLSMILGRLFTRKLSVNTPSETLIKEETKETRITSSVKQAIIVKQFQKQWLYLAVYNQETAAFMFCHAENIDGFVWTHNRKHAAIFKSEFVAQKVALRLKNVFVKVLENEHSKENIQNDEKCNQKDNA